MGRPSTGERSAGRVAPGEKLFRTWRLCLCSVVFFGPRAFHDCHTGAVELDANHWGDADLGSFPSAV